MKDVYAVLRQKEAEILRVRREIEALRSIIPLLADESLVPAAAGASVRAQPQNKWPLDVREAR
jgi:hypothetical protein